uniref:Cell division protein FtsB n=1 Tax=Candidatus Kentrum sp. TC TaxID=2126339 RepID=A0A450Y7F7_9GAMM|nr:MAG: cell division protein FtsB [Candidatus Kentron sp. TC]VFK37590.1 MAG: cell division protein FtsB [Candidatus Kentron sp. TC]VFK51866.1 MAG: cell division protein FtsB [Candidatus Kentron sp. TC]
MVKIIAVLLLVLFALQYRLWSETDGIRHIWRLQEEISLQEQENAKLEERNQRLMADVRDLKEGLTAIETRARRDLGMIHKDETFFQFIDY